MYPWPKEKKRFALALLIITALVGGLLLFSHYQLRSNTAKLRYQPPAGYSVYEDPYYGYIFAYPSDLYVEEGLGVSISNYQWDNGLILVPKGAFFVRLQAVNANSQNIDEWIQGFFKQKNHNAVSGHSLQKIEPFEGTRVPARKVTSVDDQFKSTTEDVYLLTDKGVGIIVEFGVRAEDRPKFAPIYEGIIKSVQ